MGKPVSMLHNATMGTVNDVGLRAQDTVTPATDSFDMNEATQFQGNAGPFLVSFIAWVETADLTAGALQVDHVHRDAVGNDITLPIVSFSSQLNLADPTSVVQSATTIVQRVSGSGLWQFNTTLFGLAGSAKVAYRIMVSPTDPDNYSAF